MRRAWIEICGVLHLGDDVRVALHAEGVDRNCKDESGNPVGQKVALHAEGVDRNCQDAEDFFEFVGRPPCGGRG